MITNTLGLIFIHMITLSHLVKGEEGMKALMGTQKKKRSSMSHVANSNLTLSRLLCFLLSHMAPKFGETKTLIGQSLRRARRCIPCSNHRVYLIGKPMTTHIKITYVDIKEVFLPKSGTLSISLGRNQIASTSKKFFNTNVNYT